MDLQHASYLSYSAFLRVWKRLDLFNLTTRKRPATKIRSSKGKQTPEDTPVGGDFTAIEYATERRILDVSTLEMTYYADAAGKVPSRDQHVDCARLEHHDVGNGDLAPEWGVDLVLYGAQFRYGPWADRQRYVLLNTTTWLYLSSCDLVLNFRKPFSLPIITTINRRQN